ncbi:hypothetical protein AGMMS4957_01810 [Bacteroidia bacterium]|nr:hypothetical protein AGMMS4957_01810 [Bacteroidia bacterium]
MKELIATNIFKIDKNYISKREKLINEAIVFKSGTFEQQFKTVVATLPAQKEVYFLKPGKETKRKTPNPYDMLPNVGEQDMSNWAFEQIWEYLIKISIIHKATFQKVLVLLYRLCFFIDHKENENGQIRYLPTAEIFDYIAHLESFVLKDGFQDKFKTTEVSLLEFIHFVDLLAWNEDVKYHTTDGKADFTDNSRKKVGRVNTILTIISAPILISKFINNIIENSKNNGVINVKLITTTIQKFTRTRGLCVLSNKDLLEYLSPYLEN